MNEGRVPSSLFSIFFSLDLLFPNLPFPNLPFFNLPFSIFLSACVLAAFFCQKQLITQK